MEKVSDKHKKEKMAAHAKALAKIESFILQQSLHIIQEAVPFTQSAPLLTSVGMYTVVAPDVEMSDLGNTTCPILES